MTLCELMTPFVKPPAVPPPDTIVPVDVIPTVPPKPGTVFPNVARAVTFMENGTPAACAGMFQAADDSTKKLSSGPGVTANRLLVPLSVPAVRVAVMEKVPVFENMTLCELMTPFVKPPAVPPPDTSVPVEVIPTVPAKPGTVFPNVSRAVIIMANGMPAACAGIVPPADDSTKKLSSGPGVTANILFNPASIPEICAAALHDALPI